MSVTGKPVHVCFAMSLKARKKYLSNSQSEFFNWALSSEYGLKGLVNKQGAKQNANPSSLFGGKLSWVKKLISDAPFVTQTMPVFAFHLHYDILQDGTGSSDCHLSLREIVVKNFTIHSMANTLTTKKRDQWMIRPNASMENVCTVT